MVTNSKDYQKKYMKEYNEKNGYQVECQICGIQLKKCNMYAHKKTKTHIRIEQKLNELHDANY